LQKAFSINSKERPARVSRAPVWVLAVIGIRLSVGLLFIWSGTEKIHEPFLFLSDVYGYQLTSAKIGVFVAGSLPWIELLTGIGLAFNLLPLGAPLMAIVLSSIFFYATSSAVHRHLMIECGCFGAAARQLVTPKSVVYSALLLSCCLMLFVFSVWNYHAPRSLGPVSE
jgi:hypothetical protein